jgi:hypothetical protein
MIFVYLLDRAVLISMQTRRALLQEHPHLEVLRQFHTIQDARRWATTLHLPIQDDVKKTYTGITPEGRERMRERKRGQNNPNAAGLSPAHRVAISRNKRKAYQGDGNPMFQRKHRATSRLKIGMANMKRKHRVRWAVDASGREHMLDILTPLPAGWAWGRSRTSRSF